MIKQVGNCKWWIKKINFHPFCKFYIECQRYMGVSKWYQVYKGPGENSYGRAEISRQEAKDIIIKEYKVWYC